MKEIQIEARVIVEPETQEGKDDFAMRLELQNEYERKNTEYWNKINGENNIPKIHTFLETEKMIISLKIDDILNIGYNLDGEPTMPQRNEEDRVRRQKLKELIEPLFNEQDNLIQSKDIQIQADPRAENREYDNSLGIFNSEGFYKNEYYGRWKTDHYKNEIYEFHFFCFDSYVNINK